MDYFAEHGYIAENLLSKFLTGIVFRDVCLE